MADVDKGQQHVVTLVCSLKSHSSNRVIPWSLKAYICVMSLGVSYRHMKNLLASVCDLQNLHARRPFSRVVNVVKQLQFGSG